MKAAAKATYGRKGDDCRTEELGSYDAGAKQGCLRSRYQRAGRTLRTKVFI